MKRLRFVFKRLLLVSVILGLITSNILTLLNNKAHETAFNSLTTILGSVVTQETLSRISSNSPTKKYAVIEASNKKLSTDYSILTGKYDEILKTARVSNLKHLDIVNRISISIYQRLINRIIRVAGSLAKFIPIINVFIDIELTRREVQEDCQTFDELNELRRHSNLEMQDKPEICFALN